MKATMKILALLATVAVYACAPAPSAPMATSGTPADEQAIRDLVGRIETAWNAKDVATMTAAVTEDCNFINAEGKHVQGRAEYESDLKTEFAEERPEGMALSIEVGYIQWHGADLAAVGGTWSVAGLPEAAGTPTGAWVDLFVRSGDGWQASNGLVAQKPPAPAGGN